ncbi:hypothetical protein [Moraxella lacunata]|uniref:hypothetical protein n=1 Tax=Moraxella lacunata TaxID=477 RepID=UPI0038572465
MGHANFVGKLGLGEFGIFGSLLRRILTKVSATRCSILLRRSVGRLAMWSARVL